MLSSQETAKARDEICLASREHLFRKALCRADDQLSVLNGLPGRQWNFLVNMIFIFQSNLGQNNH